jgi:hypothetical protein
MSHLTTKELNEITDFVNLYLTQEGIGYPYPKNEEGFYIFTSQDKSMDINLHAVLQDVIEDYLNHKKL